MFTQSAVAAAFLSFVALQACNMGGDDSTGGIPAEVSQMGSSGGSAGAGGSSGESAGGTASAGAAGQGSGGQAGEGGGGGAGGTGGLAGAGAAGSAGTGAAVGGGSNYCATAEIKNACSQGPKPPDGCCPLGGSLYDTVLKCRRSTLLTCSGACGTGELSSCYEVLREDGHKDVLVTGLSQGITEELESLGIHLGCASADFYDYPPCP
jgi:hypothetical protein